MTPSELATLIAGPRYPGNPELAYWLQRGHKLVYLGHHKGMDWYDDKNEEPDAIYRYGSFSARFWRWCSEADYRKETA